MNSRKNNDMISISHGISTEPRLTSLLVSDVGRGVPHIANLVIALCIVACVLASCHQEAPKHSTSHGNGMLALSTNDGIWFVNPDGRANAFYQEDSEFRWLHWSTDGCRLVIQNVDRARIYDLETGEVTEPLLGMYADLSPDGHKLVSVDDTGILSETNVYTHSLHSSDRHLVLNVPAEVRVTNTVWAPDGRRIAFVHKTLSILTDEQTSQQIATLDLMTHAIQSIYSWPDASPPTVNWLDWSPDSRRIAFAMAEENGSGGYLYILDIATGDLVELARTRYRPRSLTWSPNGDEIAYVQGLSPSSGVARRELRIVDVQTGKDRVVISEKCNDCIFWSVDWRTPQCNFVLESP